MAEKKQSHVHLPNWEGGGGYMVEKDKTHGTARRSHKIRFNLISAEINAILRSGGIVVKGRGDIIWGGELSARL